MDHQRLVRLIDAPNFEPMMPILQYPDRRLEQVADATSDDMFGSELLGRFLAILRQTMHLMGGIGLAATQVGYNERIVQVDGYSLINPVIKHRTDRTHGMSEGCLSFGRQQSIKTIFRSVEVTVEYFDAHGEEKIISLDGMHAKCVQHEIDHLNGKTLADYQTHKHNEVLLKRMVKAQKERESVVKFQAGVR